jgi:hypothetical protein
MCVQYNFMSDMNVKHVLNFVLKHVRAARALY